MLMKTRRTAAAVVTAAALGAGGVALLVPHSADAATQMAASADSTKQSTLTPAQKAELKTTGHVTVTRTTKKGKTVTVLIQRGIITALSPTSISMKSTDGYTHTYLIDGKSEIRGRGITRVGEKGQIVAVQETKGDEVRRARHGFRVS